MADSVNRGITGNSYGVVINHTTGSVHIGDQPVIVNDHAATSIFHRAYVMGREHKKMEIKQVLGSS